MELEYTYWKSKDGWFIGCLNIWPEHWTQGKNIAELEEMLLDLFEIKQEEEQAEISTEKKTGSEIPEHALHGCLKITLAVTA
jgi:predicted RNase H-like HicB family nuclease